MEQESKSLWKQLQPGIDGEQFQIQLNKSEFSANLFEKEIFSFFYNRSSLPREVHLLTGVTGYKKIRQTVKNLQMIKRLQKYGTTE
jgi:hypothetical protein